jgi:DNA ligase-1
MGDTRRRVRVQPTIVCPGCRRDYRSVTLSPVSVAALGLVSEQRGLSLRFPRFIRICDDKALEQASTPSFLAKMWSSQNGRKDRGGVDDFELMDEVDTESDGVEDEEETNIG